MLACGALFCGLLPAMLVLWARATADDVALPVVSRAGVAIALAVAGVSLMAAGMATLWRRGGGLPMNAFPPTAYVSTGIYALLPHPIYVGFTVAVAGAAMLFQSSSGLWLVAPAVALGCAALTLGYETHDLRARFGETAGGCRWLPDASDDPPATLDYLRCYLFVFLPWVALYELVMSLGVPGDALDLQLPFERRLPIAGATEILYASPYVAALLVPWLARSRRALRWFMIRSWVATAFVMPLYVALPTLAPRRPLAAHSLIERALEWEREPCAPVAACPSFHVIWAFLIVDLAAARGRTEALLARAWAWGVAFSCIATGMHAIADVVAGLGASFVLLRLDHAWEWLRATTERVANSWREWRVGPVRIINHGLYAGAGAFACLAIVGCLVGPGRTAAVVFSASAALIGAAAWAQWVEGSPRLLRPYGFYGGFAGIVLSAVAAPAFGVDPWLMLAAYSAGSPFVQSIGRLRCLVQGCCHGHPASERVGIRYRHPRSRVCRLTEFRDVPVHPTPLYSILWNGLVALAIGRLWMVGAPLHMIAGVFAILTGLGRFAEEAYRGEPQTPIIAGLRLYQWVALATIVLGALFTAVGRGGAAPAPAWNGWGLGAAAIFALITTVAFGVDFPESNRRFARLA